MKLLISRHGDCKKEINQKGFPQILGGSYEYNVGLTEKGFSQARRLSDIISQENVSAAYSSSLTRAIQTAETALKNKGISLSENELLNERHFGSLSGVFCDEAVLKYGVIHELNKKILEKLLGLEYKHPTISAYLKDVLYRKKPNINATTLITINHDFPLEHVESIDTIKERINEFEEMIRKYHGQKENVAIFTHGDVIRCWLEMIIDNPERYSTETYQKTKEMPNKGRYRSVGNCEVFSFVLR